MSQKRGIPAKQSNCNILRKDISKSITNMCKMCENINVLIISRFESCQEFLPFLQRDFGRLTSEVGEQLLRTFFNFLGFIKAGCYADKPARAVPNMDKLVGGGNYKARKDAINKCYKMAAKKGLTVFAIQDGGWCAAGKSLAAAKKYGKSTACKGGKGGPWANDVYMVKCGAAVASVASKYDNGNKSLSIMIKSSEYPLIEKIIQEPWQLAQIIIVFVLLL